MSLFIAVENIISRKVKK